MLSPSERIHRFWSAGRKRYERHAFLRFLIAGGFNAAFSYSVFCAVIWLGGSWLLALFTTTVLGTFFNFLTIGNFVFGNAKPHLLWRFFAVYILVFFCNVAGLWLLEWTGLTPILAQAILMPFIVVLSYLSNKSFTFRGARQMQRSEDEDNLDRHSLL